MSALGHQRPGPAGRRSSHVRYAPKATVGHQNAIGRDGSCVDGSKLARKLYISAKLRGGENKWSDCQFSKACLEAWVVQAGVNLTIESRNYQFRRR
jgi:hypothetical protein